MREITAFRWYTKDAEEAADLCAGIFPDSRVKRSSANAERLARFGQGG